MNRQTIIAIVLGIAAIVVVGYQLGPLFFRGRPAPPPPAPAATAPAPSAAGSARATLARVDTSSDEEMAEQLSDYARIIAELDTNAMDFTFVEEGDTQGARRKNPFQPLVGPGSLLQEAEILQQARELAGQIVVPGEDGDLLEPLDRGYKVNGIIWSDEGPLALINDQVLGVGEEIEEGGIVTAITADTVVFTYEGQSATLPVGEE